LLESAKAAIKAKQEKRMQTRAPALQNPITKDCILVLNKTDLVVPKDRVLPKIHKLNETGMFKETFLISALNDHRVDELKEYLLSRAVRKEWLFDREVSTNLTPMQRVNEIIREKFFNRLNQEIPYLVKQRNIGWTMLPDGAIRIDQTLIVRKASQKAAVIGKAGATLKKLTAEAVKDLEAILNRKVYLNVMVQDKKHYDYIEDEG